MLNLQFGAMWDALLAFVAPYMFPARVPEQILLMPKNSSPVPRAKRLRPTVSICFTLKALRRGANIRDK